MLLFVNSFFIVAALTREENQTGIQEDRRAKFPESGNQVRIVFHAKARKGDTGENAVRTSVMVDVAEVWERLSKRYRPLSVQTLIPAGFESGTAFPNRSPKSVGFSMTPEFAYASVPYSAGFLSRAIPTRP